MNRMNEQADQELIELGAASTETKGVANTPLIDSQGNHSLGGISDD